MKITVAELIEALQEMDQHAEVRLAVQPNWPFEHRLAGWPTESVNGEVVYLADGGQLDYLSGANADNIWG